MSYLAIFKRIIPFFLTFAAGLFIASFFIQISAPTFPKAEGRKGKRHGYNKLWEQNKDLRRENELLRQENEMLRQMDKHDWNTSTLKYEVPSTGHMECELKLKKK